jgi:hypothetical protein
MSKCSAGFSKQYLKTTNIKFTAISWNMSLYCHLVDIYWHFRGMCCFDLAYSPEVSVSLDQATWNVHHRRWSFSLSVAMLTYGLDLTTRVTTLLDDLNIIVNHITFVMWFVCFVQWNTASIWVTQNRPHLCFVIFRYYCTYCRELLENECCCLWSQFVLPSLILVFFFNDNTQKLVKHCYKVGRISTLYSYTGFKSWTRR